MQRLDKFLSDSGAGTRSQVKLILKAGRVMVDGITATDGARKIDPQAQKVFLDGEPVCAASRLVVMLHKPEGFVTATEDAVERTVMELLPPEWRNRDLKPVGRLDKQTEGLLLFTNDGDLLHRLISPRSEVSKTYFARHEGIATDEDIKAFREGLTLRDGTKCLPARLEPVGQGQSRITVYEGKYHQVRRMMASRGMHVLYLQRQKEGGLSLGDLPLGQTRLVSEEEICLLLLQEGNTLPDA